MTPQDFPALCPRGHRIVPSSGDHWTVVQTGPGIYEYLTGRCEDLPDNRSRPASVHTH